MKRAGELLSAQRKLKKISLDRASRDLLIKRHHLEAIEEGVWQNLPESAYIKGFVKNYAQYLGLDESHVLALFRREYDESKYPTKHRDLPKKLSIPPVRIVNLTFILAIVLFLLYVLFQYLSILSSPKLEVYTPTDDINTFAPIIEVTGYTETGSTLAINGEFVPVDSQGNFSHQVNLKEGQNIIEIIASKRLSPKSKVTKIVRKTP